MKTKKLFILGAMMFALLVMFSSCERDVTDIYHYRIDYEIGNDQGKAIVFEYIAAQGIFTGDRAFTSERTHDNDNEALDVFDENVAKIKRSELGALLDKRSGLYRTDVIFFYDVYTGTAENPVMIASKEFAFD
ncbi:MAG: hypothetical protein LBO74_00250 [Candidatus Symbiothrix sp.]|jgi:hypothetical protein|nr:hypothetical protein [Candidatus Symbiothrix sp.]